MSAKEELQEKIKFLQNKIDACEDDAAAILLQKKLVDLFREVIKNKDFLTELVNQNNK